MFCRNTHYFQIRPLRKARLLDPPTIRRIMEESAKTFRPTASLAQFNFMPLLHYGADLSVQLEFSQGVAPDLCGTPRGVPLKIWRPR